nr:hypothetical protein [Mucilaginibacter sp. L294]
MQNYLLYGASGVIVARWMISYFIGALPAAGLYAHTAQALGAGPVSAALPNADMLSFLLLPQASRLWI